MMASQQLISEHRFTTLARTEKQESSESKRDEGEKRSDERTDKLSDEKEDKRSEDKTDKNSDERVESHSEGHSDPRTEEQQPRILEGIPLKVLAEEPSKEAEDFTMSPVTNKNKRKDEGKETSGRQSVAKPDQVYTISKIPV